MAKRDLSRPPAGWSNREGKSTLKAWRELSPAYRSQVMRARERGYAGSVWEMTKARAAGKLSPTDQAIRAEQRTERNRYVTPLGQGRWNFFARVTSDDAVPNLAGRRALQRNVERAARLGNRNLTAKLVDVNGLQGTVGGRGGVSARYVLDEGQGNALRGLRAILNRAGGGSAGGELDTIATVSMFVFPVERSAAA